MSLSNTIKDCLTPAETAEILGICLDTVYRQLKVGKIPSVKFGTTYRIPVIQLKKLLETGRC